MNIVSFHKQDLQLVIQYLSIAGITRLSEELRFFSANPNSYRSIARPISATGPRISMPRYHLSSVLA